MSVRVHILGGLNEIGGNKVLVEDGQDRLLLDFGTGLGSHNAYFDTFTQPRTTVALTDLLRLGLLPWVDGIYRHDYIELALCELDGDTPESAVEHRQRTGRDYVHGVLLTHAHLDHYGDLDYLDPEVPVYCTATTRTMLETIAELQSNDTVTLTERSLGETSSRSTFPGDGQVETQGRRRTLKVCPEQAWFHVGPFRCMAVPVDHSVPGAVAYLVETPSGKTILYTGDVRFHGRLTDRTKALRETCEGLAPDLVLTEGTRVAETDSDDEGGVERGVTRLVDDCQGLAITEFGWKDTTRFDTLQQVAARTGRTLVVNPKLAYLLRRLDHLRDVPSRAVEHYDNVAVALKRRGTMRYQPSDYRWHKHEAGYLTDWNKKALQAAWKGGDEVTLKDPLAHVQRGVRAHDLREHPDRYLLHLSLWDITDLLDVAPPEGSHWVRCLTEPYSEEMELDLQRQVRWMDHFGLAHNVTADGTLHDQGLTHVSGHAAGSDLLPFLTSIEARTVVPIHTEREKLGAFEDAGLDPVTFPDKDHRDAAAGDVVIEL